MAWTSDDLDKIEKAISTGTREVEYSTGRIVYRTLKDMLKIRDVIRRSLGLGSAMKQFNPKTSKGL